MAGSLTGMSEKAKFVSVIAGSAVLQRPIFD
jgi:hypothetical protein